MSDTQPPQKRAAMDDDFDPVDIGRHYHLSQEDTPSLGQNGPPAWAPAAPAWNQNWKPGVQDGLDETQRQWTKTVAPAGGPEPAAGPPLTNGSSAAATTTTTATEPWNEAFPPLSAAISNKPAATPPPQPRPPPPGLPDPSTADVSDGASPSDGGGVGAEQQTVAEPQGPPPPSSWAGGFTLAHLDDINKAVEAATAAGELAVQLVADAKAKQLKELEERRKLSAELKRRAEEDQRNAASRQRPPPPKDSEQQQQQWQPPLQHRRRREEHEQQQQRRELHRFQEPPPPPPGFQGQPPPDQFQQRLQWRQSDQVKLGLLRSPPPPPPDRNTRQDASPSALLPVQDTDQRLGQPPSRSFVMIGEQASLPPPPPPKQYSSSGPSSMPEIPELLWRRRENFGPEDDLGDFPPLSSTVGAPRQPQAPPPELPFGSARDVDYSSSSTSEASGRNGVTVLRKPTSLMRHVGAPPSPSYSAPSYRRLLSSASESGGSWPKDDGGGSWPKDDFGGHDDDCDGDGRRTFRAADRGVWAGRDRDRDRDRGAGAAGRFRNGDGRRVDDHDDDDHHHDDCMFAASDRGGDWHRERRQFGGRVQGGGGYDVDRHALSRSVNRGMSGGGGGGGGGVGVGDRGGGGWRQRHNDWDDGAGGGGRRRGRGGENIEYIPSEPANDADSDDDSEPQDPALNKLITVSSSSASASPPRDYDFVTYSLRELRLAERHVTDAAPCQRGSTDVVDTHCHIDFLLNKLPKKYNVSNSSSNSNNGTVTTSRGMSGGSRPTSRGMSGGGGGGGGGMTFGTTVGKSYKRFQDDNSREFGELFGGCIACFCAPGSFANIRDYVSLFDLDGIWGSFGCHPHWVSMFNGDCRKAMVKALRHPKVVATGEIGLDYSGRGSSEPNVELQQEVFRDQLDIGLELGKPLVIHCRDAHDDCLRIMKEMVPKDYKIHRHCVTQAWSEIREWREAFPNCYFGFTNFITMPRAGEAHESVQNLPVDRILLETDAPYHLPVVLQGTGIKASHPGMIIHVAAQIACLKGLTLETVIRHCRSNTRALYGI